MLEFFFIFTILEIIPRVHLSDIGCNTHATILRQFEREGFHIDVHYLIEIVIDVETASKWDDCSLVIRENLTNSFYVNPDQLTELNRTGFTSACTPQKVDIEAPKHLSTGHNVFIYGTLERSQNLIHSRINFPMHLRYHKPEINGGFSTADFKFPVLLIRCPNIDCKNLIKSKAPCHYCGQEICNWMRFPYKTNNNNMTLAVPVGNLNHLWFVSLITYLLTFGGCLYLLLAILIKDELQS